MKTKDQTLQQKLEADAAAAFPPELLDPWKAKAAVRVPGWRAAMLPVLGSKLPPLYTLSRDGQIGGWDGAPSFSVSFTGTDQDALLSVAQKFVAP